MLPLAVILILFSMLLYWRADKRSERTYGSARWARVWVLFREKLFVKSGLRIGDWITGLGVHYDGTHALTLGATGSGKGVSAILPNLLRAKRVFLVDPGGENTAIASKHWREHGYAFCCINPFGMFTEAPYALPSNAFNPLDLLDPASETFSADALLFAQMLTPRTKFEGGSSAYFKEASERVKRALIIHVKTTEPPERQNLGRVYELICGGPNEWDALIEAMKANPVCGGLVMTEGNNLERIDHQSSSEISGIMSSVQQDLSWLADPLIRAKTAYSDVDFALLKSSGVKGCIISVVIPLQFIETHASITRLAMACTVLAMERRPWSAENVLFLIDEAAALGQIVALPVWLATLRKYRVQIWTIWQNLGQLVQLYGQNWQGIVGNCGLMQLLGVADLQTADYTAKMLGQATVRSVSSNARGERSFSLTARPLLTPDEITRLRRDRQIVCIAGLPPILLRKTPYWLQPDLAGRYHENPYFDGKAARPDAAAAVRQIVARIYFAFVCLMAPHPAVAVAVSCLSTLSVLLWLASS